MARKPMRPMRRPCDDAPAMPATSDEKMSGATIILMRRKKSAANGRNEAARGGVEPGARGGFVAARARDGGGEQRGERIGPRDLLARQLLGRARRLGDVAGDERRASAQMHGFDARQLDHEQQRFLERTPS